MRPSTLVVASLLVGLTGGAPALASPSTPIAGCGVGFARDAAGRCHRRFDLFRQYSQFRAFKTRDCTRIQTPDGRVDRCRI